MESDFIQKLIKESEHFKEMQNDLKEGKAVDLGGIMSLIVELPKQLDNTFNQMSAKDKKANKPYFDKLKKETSLENIFSKMYADNKK